MKLMVETIDNSGLQYIKEASEDGKKKTYKIKGTYLQAETKNKNGRIYSKSLLEREVGRYNDEKISQGRAIAELDHPPTPTINLERVSHIIDSLKMEGNDGVGSARILDTPMGNIASTLLDQGVKLGISTRGVGSLNGAKVNEDYRLIAIDLVADPSAPNAFVEGILEGKEYMIQGEDIVEQAIEELEDTLAKKGQKAIYEGMQKFLKSVQENFKKDR